MAGQNTPLLELRFHFLENPECSEGSAMDTLGP